MFRKYHKYSSQFKLSQYYFYLDRKPRFVVLKGAPRAEGFDVQPHCAGVELYADSRFKQQYQYAGPGETLQYLLFVAK